MSSKYSVSLEKLLKDNQFEKLYMPKAPEDIFITSPDVNRPGLILSGFESYFDNERINFANLIYEVESILRKWLFKLTQNLHHLFSFISNGAG